MFRHLNPTAQVASSSAFGALIGGAVGDQCGRLLGFPHLLAIILGFLVGGLTGYVTADFRGLCQGIKRAWDQTDWPAFRQKLGQSIRERITVWFLMSLALLSVTSYFLALYLLDDIPRGFVLLVLAISCAMGFLLSVLGMPLSSAQMQAKYLIPISPPVLPFTLVYGIYRLVRYLRSHWDQICETIVQFGQALGSFGKRAFLYVHSDRRMVSFWGAGIGAAVGVACGNYLVGMLAGVAMGLLSFLLVSRRLGLIPAA